MNPLPLIPAVLAAMVVAAADARVLPQTIDFTLITNMAGIGALGFTTTAPCCATTTTAWRV
jgi:hypothetical protein